MTNLRMIPGVFSARWRFSLSQSSSATLIQGWLNTASADSRFDASLTNKLQIKSLASSLTSHHSSSGKQKWPTRIEANFVNFQPFLKIQIEFYLHESTQIAAPGICNNFHHDSIRTLDHNYQRMVDSQKVRCRQSHQDSINHIVYHSCFLARQQIDQLPRVP